MPGLVNPGSSVGATVQNVGSNQHPPRSPFSLDDDHHPSSAIKGDSATIPAEDDVSRTIESYEPLLRLPADVRQEIESFVRLAVQDSQQPTPRAASCALVALTRLTVWGWTVGYPLERHVLLHRRVIAQFANDGCSDMKQTSRATYRSRLFAISDSLLEAPHRFVPIPGIGKGKGVAPYSERDIADLRSWASGQGTEARRVNATILLALGLGAGLPAVEIGTVRALDVIVDAHGVLIDPPGDRRRTIPVLAEWEEPIAALVRAIMRKDQWLFRPQRRCEKSVNLVSNFVGTSTSPPFQITAQRLRATWLVRHMAAGTPINLLVKVAGLESSEGLSRYVEYVPDIDVSAARRRLRSCSAYMFDDGESL